MTTHFMTNGKFWTTDCIRHPKRRLCVCCPNGIHVDAELDVFYKTLTKMQQRSANGTATLNPSKQFKYFKRKQDPTVDALLGGGQRTQSTVNLDETFYKRRDTPARASTDVQVSLEQALHDFEETLIRSSNNDIRSSPLSSPLLPNDQFSSSQSLRIDVNSDNNIFKFTNGDKSYEPDSTTVSDERKSSPVRLRDTEVDCSVPTRTSEIISTLDNIFRFTNGDKSDEPNSMTATDERRSCPVRKDAGIDCSVTTRDIGTIPTPIRTRDIGTGCAPPSTRDVGVVCAFVEYDKMPAILANRSTRTKNVATCTEATTTTPAVQNDHSLRLDQILNAAKVSTVGTQTVSKLTSLFIVEKRDRGVQTDENRLSDSIHRRCDNAPKKYRSVATSTNVEPIEYKRMYSKYCQTKDVVVKDRVFVKKIACQTDMSMQRCKEIGVNTTRRKMVDASTGHSGDDFKFVCDRCSQMATAKTTVASPTTNAIGSPSSQSTPIATNESVSNVSQSVSKIPRPTSVPNTGSSNRKNLLMRQDTYVTIPSTELEKLKELQLKEERTFENFCRDKIMAMQNHVSPIPSIPTNQSYFQPISEIKIKAEPSKEMKAAIKVVNASLKKTNFSTLRETTLKSAIAVILHEWFKISSLSTADCVIIEDYLDALGDVSAAVLEFVVNLKDPAGNTAMHYAVSHGNFDVVSVLLDSKVCDINIVNDAGYTCVMLVSLAQIKSNSHCDVIKRLFHMGDVNAKAKQHGQTTLMLAASHGKLEVIELLLESGADVNTQDDDGSTALMCAAEHGYLDIVNALVAHPGCDLLIKDNDGSTALTIAMEAGHREIGIALYTRQHFADLNEAKEKRSRSANPILMEYHRNRASSLRSTPSSFA